jgi:pimeloyl-ACP methyl ester carboxylesterase
MSATAISAAATACRSSSTPEGISYLLREGTSESPALVLLHGIGSNARSWLAFMSALDTRLACLAWDLPGYGASRALVNAWPTAEDYSIELERVLDRLALGSVVLVGHSLGALIAAHFAATRRARSQALVLASAAAGYGAPPNGPLPPGVAKRLSDFEELGAADYARLRAPRLLADPQATPDVTLAVETAMAALTLPGYAQAVRFLGCADIFQDLRSLAVPTVVVCGACDRITPPEQARRIAAAIPAPARYRSEMPLLIEQTGHALPQERPAEFAQLCSALTLATMEACNAHDRRN